MTLFQLSYLLLWVLALVLALASVVLLYLLARFQERVARTGTGYGAKFIGRELPFSFAKDAHSGTATRVQAFEHRPHVVLLLSPDCGSCRSLLSELAAATEQHLADLPLSLVCVGSLDACQAAIAKIHSVAILLQDVRNGDPSDLRFVGFPAAFMLDDTGVVTDVRHPWSLQGVMAAVDDAVRSGGAHNDVERARQRADALAVGAGGT